MHRVLFLLAAAGFVAGSLSWVTGARRAYRRAVAVEHRGLQAAQWRSLAAKDGLAGALLLSLVPLLVAKALQGHTSAGDWFWLVAVMPLLASLAWIRRFHQLAGLIETEADYAQHQRERVDQEAELASTVATRLGAANVETPGGVLLRTLFHPAEGVVGGDFLGTATAGEAVWFMIGDVSGHGLEAAVKALRLKDLVLTAAVAGLRLGDALALGNGLLWADPSGEALATVFVARYGDGVRRYANAGHLPGHLLNGGAAAASEIGGGDGNAGAGGGDQLLPPTGPLLGLVEHPVIGEREVALAPGFRVVVYTDGLLEAYGRLGGLGDQEVVRLVVQGEFALLHERLNTRRPEPLRDDIAAIEFIVPAAG
jgi:serine phosphatase RsbU (regulator of sigma subunit)